MEHLHLSQEPESQHGFRTISDVFMEDGIPHVDMLLHLYHMIECSSSALEIVYLRLRSKN
ncbi:hypothetical protein [Fictibacillus solisalsi]|uniref:hypothetical protein n=1 Tax=Fictibacillus solisalsi TaxID=459525 RepID=UPI000AC91D82|nr:hypothetical protein [Fictibacillus solisalsi]